MQTLVLVESTQDHFDDLVREMNRRKYPLNSHRDGYSQPSVAEIRLLDIRAKKEVMPQIMRDLNATYLLDEKTFLGITDSMDCKKISKTPKLKKYFVLSTFWLFRKLFSKIGIYPDSFDRNLTRTDFCKGWHYAYSLGHMKDMERDGVEEL